MNKTTSISKLRGELSNYIRDLPEEKSLQVLRHNEIVAILLDPGHYQQMLERIDDIEDIRDMLLAMKDYFDGDDMTDADELFKELGL